MPHVSAQAKPTPPPPPAKKAPPPAKKAAPTPPPAKKTGDVNKNVKAALEKCVNILQECVQLL